jgi:hypothetical protein
MMLALAFALAVQEPVRVQINHDEFSAGDRARVYVQSSEDGHLVVLHADPAGRVRVLFPVDPTDDDFVRAGKKFEVRGRNNRDAFQIDGTEGSGIVLAAVSPDGFNFDAFTRNDHWDFRALGGPSDEGKSDPLATLVDIVQRMTDSSRQFEYDQATYVVQSYGNALRGYRSPYPYPYPRFRIGVSFGYPFYSAFYDPFCDPFWGCYGGWGWGYPYRYGYFYRPIYRSRPLVFASFGVRYTRRPQFIFPRTREVVTPVNARPRTIVQPASRSRGIGSWAAPTRRAGSSRPTLERGRASSISQPRGARSSGGSRGAAARPSNRGGGRRH